MPRDMIYARPIPGGCDELCLLYATCLRILLFIKEEFKEYLAEIGRKGGQSGRGKSKARTSEQARAAVNARWAKAKADKKGCGKS